MGGINFDWLAISVLSPDWQCRKMEVCDIATFVRYLDEAAGHGWVSAGRAPTFASYTLAFALQVRKNYGKPSVRVTQARSADRRRTRFV